MKRHWRGALPLPVSFWGAGLVILLGTYAIGEFMAWQDSKLIEIHVELVAECIAFAVLTVVWTWWGVGTWRSATRRSRTGARWWASSAKLVAGLGMVLSLYLWAADAFLMIGDTLSDIAGDPLLGHAGVRVIAGGTELEVYGTITRTQARVLDKALAYGRPVTRVRFDSTGGRADAGLEIKHIIEAHGVDTLVENECSSACVFAFLGGKHRWVTEQARVGFHRIRSFGADDPGTSDTVRRIMANAGIEPDFLDKAFATPFTSMWYPSLDELLASGVITGVVPGEADVDKPVAQTH